MLAELTGVLRANRSFREALYTVTDAMREEYGVCPRGPDGYYGGLSEAIVPADLWNAVGEMADRLCVHDLGQQAVGVLHDAGWRARVNEVGHVAVAVDG
jgi:hypothetical protein